MRGKILAPLAIIVGLGMLYGGYSSLNETSVTCGGKTMHSGDTCKETSRKTGHTTRRSMSQQRDSNKQTGWILIGLGSLATVGGIVSTIGAYRRRPAGPQNFPPPAGQPYSPPPANQPYSPPPGGQPYYPPPGGQPPGGPYYPPPGTPPSQ